MKDIPIPNLVESNGCYIAVAWVDGRPRFAQGK